MFFSSCFLIFCFVCLCFLCLCFCFSFVATWREAPRAVVAFKAFVTTLSLLGIHHCAIVCRHVPCCDVASGHVSSCFNSCLHKVKLLLNVSK